MITPVIGAQEELHRTGTVARGHGKKLDVAATIDNHVAPAEPQITWIGFECKDSPGRTACLGHRQGMEPNIRSDVDRAIARSEEMGDKFELKRLVRQAGSQGMGDSVVAPVKAHIPGPHSGGAVPQQRGEQEVGISKKREPASQAGSAGLGDYR
jgi:hypothetical protein